MTPGSVTLFESSSRMWGTSYTLTMSPPWRATSPSSDSSRSGSRVGAMVMRARYLLLPDHLKAGHAATPGTSSCVNRRTGISVITFHTMTDCTGGTGDAGGRKGSGVTHTGFGGQVGQRPRTLGNSRPRRPSQVTMWDSSGENSTSTTPSWGKRATWVQFLVPHSAMPCVVKVAR